MTDWKFLVRRELGPLPLDPARAEDIVEELAQHVSQDHAELVASGVPEPEATAAALRPLRDHPRVAAEIARSDRPRPTAPSLPVSRGALVPTLIRDARYAVRLLTLTPSFTATVLVMLALAIGANTAIFSVISAVWLRPLPYADPDRLVVLGHRADDGSAGNLGYTTFVDWRERSHSFEALALIRSWYPTLVVHGRPERVAAMRVSSNYFRLLGVAPAIGRDFEPADDTQNGWRVVLISHGFWRTRFDADPQIAGRVITMNDRQYTIIGVMPATFEPLISEHFYLRAEMWAPLGYDTTLPYACRSCQHLKALGRVKDGIALDTARADLETVQSALRAEHPAEYDRDTAVPLVPLADELTGRVRPVLALLMGAVLFVLLIACANVATLLLARMTRREEELALRAALGAGRAELVRQLMVENVILAVAGTAVGLVLCVWGVPLLARLSPTPIARIANARVDATVLVFSLGLSLGTSLLFGLMPALRASRIDLQAMLHSHRRTGRAPASLTRRLLVATNVALAAALLVAAGLMIKSVGRLLEVDPGFRIDHVLTMQTSFVGPAYATDPQVLVVMDRILDRLGALPGVTAAAAASQIPLGGNGDRWGFHIRSRPTRSPADDPSVERYAVTPAYFDVMGIPLIRGRLFSSADSATTEPVLIIGKATAQKLWPGQDPIGEQVRVGDPDNGPWRTIVGIVGDVRHQALASPPTMQMYTPQTQNTDSFLTFVVKTDGEPAALAAEARAAVWAAAGDVPVYGMAPLDELATKSVGSRRFVTVLLGFFGLVALLLTATGVYGAIAYSVAERTREIGIRSALGASASHIVGIVFGGSMSIVVAGVAIGLGLALATSRYLGSSLYSVSATDPITFASVAAVLVGVAALAHAVPIVRALRVSPTIALRQE